MKWPRASGILVHPTSLPGRYGIGDLGPGALRMLDFLTASGQKLWQTLPLGPTGYGNSPYAMLSAFAGNPLLISPDRLLEEGLLTPDDLDSCPAFPVERVDYSRVLPWKMALLRRSFERFRSRARPALREEFASFRAAQRGWLDDFALYAALKAGHGDVAWVQWDTPLATRDPDALSAARLRLADDVAFHAYTQFIFFRQWAALREAARERSISIIGDLAIFVAHDSADVWAHPELFQLEADGSPTVVAGVPPDYFSPTGQRWGNPLYRWDVLAETGYAWWIERVRRALELEDFIRLDHFRGFRGYWEVPASAETAVNGRWVPGPGDAFFSAIREALGDVPFIAEDLGVITAGVRALRKSLRFPGMKVLQFAFGGSARNAHLPHNYTRDLVVYTGTHDNDTTRGWFASREAPERAHVLAYLDCGPGEVVWEMIRAALASVATLAIVPLQDVLDLGSEARMNYPSRADNNWEWRCAEEQLTRDISERMARLSALYGR